MKYIEAKKIQVGDYIYLPEAKRNLRIADITEEDKQIFFRVDNPRKGIPIPALVHHTAAKKALTTEELAEMYITGLDTLVILNYNDELGEWRWAVEVVNSDGFWLDSFTTEDEAKEFIEQNNLKAVVTNAH